MMTMYIRLYIEGLGPSGNFSKSDALNLKFLAGMFDYRQ